MIYDSPENKTNDVVIKATKELIELKEKTIDKIAKNENVPIGFIDTLQLGYEIIIDDFKKLGRMLISLYGDKNKLKNYTCGQDVICDLKRHLVAEKNNYKNNLIKNNSDKELVKVFDLCFNIFMGSIDIFQQNNNEELK